MRWSKEEDETLRTLLARGIQDYNLISREYFHNRSADSVRSYATKILSSGKPIVEPQVHMQRSIVDLLEGLKGEYKNKRARADQKRSGINIALPDDGPFGVLCFGDPHLGDPGCDIEHLSECLAAVRETPHLYALNIGDFTNNWVGGLRALYKNQTTTDEEEISLIRWILKENDWLFVILGNHDKWSSACSLICKEYGINYASHGARLNIRAGLESFVIEARHQWPGKSQYAPDFGAGKAHFRGIWADLIVGGHTHEGADSTQVNGYSLCRAKRVNLGAFKREDEYADMLGFRQNSTGPMCIAVFNPMVEQGGADRVQTWWSIDGGVDHLRLLRQKWKKNQKQSLS